MPIAFALYVLVCAFFLAVSDRLVRNAIKAHGQGRSWGRLCQDKIFAPLVVSTIAALTLVVFFTFISDHQETNLPGVLMASFGIGFGFGGLAGIAVGGASALGAYLGGRIEKEKARTTAFWALMALCALCPLLLFR